jgi:hypothetical protein
MKKVIFLLLSIGLGFNSYAQSEDQLGAWYMYFGNFRFTDTPWAIHAEAQYRDNQILGDLEQLLLRTGLQYNLKSGQASFLAGYASITTGTLGESTATFHENRIYQEAILRQKLGRVSLMHRYRFEQRWIAEQNFRTRVRYGLFLNIPLNSKEMNEKGSVYIQVYDELFINTKKLTASMQYFDRNRIYMGLGLRPYKNLALQFGFMDQSTNNFSKPQLQFSVFHQGFLK